MTDQVNEAVVERVAEAMYYFPWSGATEPEKNYWRGKARLALTPLHALLQAAYPSRGVVDEVAERRALNKALDALDALSERWASEIGLDAMCANLAKAEDVPAAIRAMAVQAWVEGAYAGRTSHQAPQPDDQHPDDAAVDRFAAAMKAKLAEARAKGRGGWHEPDLQQRLSDMLREHVDKGDPRDVANFACFLFNRGEAIAPAALPAVPEGESVTLTVAQIADLARFAGLTLAQPPQPTADELEAQITVCECPDTGVLLDGEDADPGLVAHYTHTAYYSEYPSEGCIGLGPELVATPKDQPAQGEG